MAYNTRTELMAEANFDGIPFRVRTETISSQGRRIIVHEYLNSNRIFAEDIGQIPPYFSIDAFIHSDLSANNFLEKAEAFRTKLNRKLNKPGKLTLPTIGNVRVIALDFSESRSQTSVGEVTFNLKFVKATGSIVANVAPARESDIFSASDDAREVITETSPKFYSIPETINNRLTVLHDFTSQVNDTSNKARNFLTSGPLGEARTTIRNFVTNLPNLINTPQNLVNTYVATGESDVGVFQDLSNRLSNPTSVNSFDLASNSSRSGSGLFNDMRSIRNDVNNVDDSTDPSSFEKPIWSATTVERSNRNMNRNFAIDMNRVNWLLIAYEQAANRDYTTSTEVENIRNELSTMYDNVVLTAAEDLDSLISDLTLIESINNVRDLTLEVLELKEQQAFNLTTINYPFPLDVISLTYQLYAEEFNTFNDLEERATLIKQLNPDQQSDRMVGDITILEVRQ